MELSRNSSKAFQIIDHLDDGKVVQDLSKVELINFNHLNENSVNRDHILNFNKFFQLIFQSQSKLKWRRFGANPIKEI